MTARLKPHPAAELFPMLSDAEIDELAEDLKTRGQLHKGVVLDGKILDGRHREEACHRAGVPFDLEQWSDVVARAADPVRAAMSPVEWVLSTNLRRRHLNETQRAVIAEEALPLLEAEARARQKTGKKVEAPGAHNWAKLDAGKLAALNGIEVYRCTHCGAEHPHHQGWKWIAPVAGCSGPSEAQTLAPRGAKGPARDRPGSKAPKKGKASELAAKAVGASARSVERAKAVLKKRPELREQLKAAKMTLKQAEKAIKREEQHKQVLEYRPPKGTYSVIVTDVPWRYDDELDGSDQARSGVQYPTMSVDEICDMNVGKNLAAPDCALWFWVTTAFLIDGTAARVLAAWGFEPKTMLTWVKDRFGAGRYLRNQTEHCILAVRGKPMITGEAVANVLNAPRRGHSEKPDEFFSLVEKVCPARDRLELFARKQRDGWVTSGAELPTVSTTMGAHASVVTEDVEPDETIVAGPIVWKPKKHPSIVAIGEATTRRWSIEQTRARAAKGGDRGKKIDRHEYFWRCERDSSKLFDTEELAKTDAAQQELLWQSQDSLSATTAPSAPKKRKLRIDYVDDKHAEA